MTDRGKAALWIYGIGWAHAGKLLGVYFAVKLNIVFAWWANKALKNQKDIPGELASSQ